MDIEVMSSSGCIECGETITLPVHIFDVWDEDGSWEDVAVEVDMTQWHAHWEVHRDARASGQAVPQS